MRRATHLLAVTLLAASPAVAGAALIQVPGEVGTIQAAIDGASDGDVIQIAPGTYATSLVLRGGVTLVGGGPRPEDTVLSGSYMHPLIKLEGDSRPARVENLTLRDGFGYKGAGMELQGAVLDVYRVRFVSNAAALEGGAIYATSSLLTLRECLFYANYAQGGEGRSIYIQGDDQTGRAHVVENCTWAGNAGCCGGISLVISDCRVEVTNSILEEVTCLAGGDGYFACNNGTFCGTDGGGNFFADPRYCGFENADCRLEPESPCLPENNPDCGLIGAFGGCGLTATAETSFSALKSLY